MTEAKCHYRPPLSVLKDLSVEKDGKALHPLIGKVLGLVVREFKQIWSSEALVDE